MEPLIHFRGAVSLLGRFPALAGVDLDVAPGEIVLLQGPNGAGKTTLLRCCAGLVPVVDGTAEVLGHDLRRSRKAVRRRVGLLGHTNGLYDELTVEDNVRFWCRAAKADAADVDAAMAQLGLAGRLRDVPVARLSAGQRRRTALAILVARRPELWLLDEPHAGLDVEGRDLIDELAGQAARAGATVLIASHDHDRAVAVADRCVTIAGGTVVDGGVEEGGGAAVVHTSPLAVPVDDAADGVAPPDDGVGAAPALTGAADAAPTPADGVDAAVPTAAADGAAVAVGGVDTTDGTDPVLSVDEAESTDVAIDPPSEPSDAASEPASAEATPVSDEPDPDGWSPIRALPGQPPSGGSPFGGPWAGDPWPGGTWPGGSGPGGSGPAGSPHGHLTSDQPTNGRTGPRGRSSDARRTSGGAANRNAASSAGFSDGHLNLGGRANGRARSSGASSDGHSEVVPPSPTAAPIAVPTADVPARPEAVRAP